MKSNQRPIKRRLCIRRRQAENSFLSVISRSSSLLVVRAPVCRSSAIYMHRGRRLKSSGRRQYVPSVLQANAGFQEFADGRWFPQVIDGAGCVLDRCRHAQTGVCFAPGGPGQGHRFAYQAPGPHLGYDNQVEHYYPVSPVPILGRVAGVNCWSDSPVELVYKAHKVVSHRMGTGSSKEAKSSDTTVHKRSNDRLRDTATGSRKNAKSKKAYRMIYSGNDDQQDSNTDDTYGAQPASASVAKPARITGGSGSRSTRRQPNNDDVDNVNEAHNNFVMTSPQSDIEERRQSPRSLHLPPTPTNASSGYGIKVVRIKVAIDKRLTVVDERSPSVLKYKTPHFRALATVEVPPLMDGQRIQIGWIQVCRDMTFVNVYGEKGITSWEFPEIVINKYRMISDADGKQYPWYGSKTEVHNVEGPTAQPNFVTIHMNDNFFPQVTWYIPHSDHNREPSLEFIYRKQRFYTYLAVRDLNTNVYQILKTVAWMMELSIQVDPLSPLGERARVLGPVDQEKPRVFDDTTGIRLETYALNPPNANNSQVLVWRPRIGDPKIVVPPVQTTIDVNRYLMTTKDQYAKLKQTLVKNKIPF